MKMEEQNKLAKREEVCPGKKGKLDLDSLRAQIDEAGQKAGPEYWRSLEELAGSPAFQEALHREFPKGASEWVDSVSRRGFLKVMGASMALAGMTGCVRLPLEPIVPYVRQPEDVIPGRPQFYATAMTLGGYASLCWSRAISDVPQRLKATTSTRRRLAAPTFLRRLTFSACTILTARRAWCRWATSAPGSRS